MQKREITVFSIFGVLLALTSFVENFIVAKSFALGAPFNGKSIPEEVFKQITAVNHYAIAVGYVFRILFVLFLLYVGWKIAYRFLGLRYIIPITLAILIVPALIEFALQPGDKTVWYALRDNIIRAAIWISIMKIYYITSKKVQLKNLSV